MTISRRGFFLGSAGSLLAASAGCASARRSMAGSFALGPDGVVGVGVSGLREKLRVFVIGDTHLGLFTCGNPAWGAATDPY